MSLEKLDGEEFLEDFERLLRSIDHEVEFFEVSPYFIHENLKNYILRILRKFTAGVEKSLLKKSNADEIHQCQEIKKNLQKTLETAVEQSFLKMEPKFFDIFKIPEDKLQGNQCTNQDIEKIDDEIDQLTKRYKRAVCLEVLLREELQSSNSLDMMKKKVMELEDSVSSVSNKFDGENLIKCNK